MKWNIFVMIINILNNENTATLSIYTKNSYDAWWKQDGFGRDVTSIGLDYSPIYKWNFLIMAFPTIYIKRFKPSPPPPQIIPVFWIPLHHL